MRFITTFVLNSLEMLNENIIAVFGNNRLPIESHTSHYAQCLLTNTQNVKNSV